MTIVAEKFEYVIGVDTHARTHTFAILHCATGKIQETQAFPVTEAGMRRALDWAGRRAGGRAFLAAVEGTSSYGASLTRLLEDAGVEVAEAKPPRRATRRQAGKSDPIDAAAAARSVAGTDLDNLVLPRTGPIRSALRVLLVARRAIDKRRTADRNTLTAMLRSIELGLDVRKALTDTQIAQIAAWRTRAGDDTATATIRAEARRLATAIITASSTLEANMAALRKHVTELAPDLLKVPGVGPFSAAILLTAYSHHGRVRSEAAFAHLAGAAPIPASSGNTTRHRLSRGGDRQLNRALDTIARTRLSYDANTRAYAERRANQGRTPKEIKRCLKRYIARQLFRQMNTLVA